MRAAQRTFSLILFLIFVFSSMISFSLECPFVDIKGHWAEKNIEEFYSKGYIKGIPVKDTLEAQPGRSITRAEFVTFLIKIDNFVVKKENLKNFNDLKTNYWYEEPINIAVSNLLIKGYPDNSFKPDQPITRAEIATVVFNTLKGYSNLESSQDSKQEIFPDLKEDDWFYEGVMFNKSHGIIHGFPDGTFRPRSNATRAEAVTIINNLIAIKSANSENSSVSNVLGYTVSGNPGTKVSYPIYIDRIQGLGKFSFKILYDPAKLQAIGILDGTLKERHYVSYDLKDSAKGEVLVYSNDTSDIVDNKGILLTAIFRIVPLSSGTAEIKFKGVDSDTPQLYMPDGKIIPNLRLQSGIISIKDINTN